jgi:hypothetical protein
MSLAASSPAFFLGRGFDCAATNLYSLDLSYNELQGAT